MADGPTLRAACDKLWKTGASLNQRVYISLHDGERAIYVGVGNTLNSLLICN